MTVVGPANSDASGHDTHDIANRARLPEQVRSPSSVLLPNGISLMPTPASPRAILGLVLLLIGGAALAPSAASAQDRGVPAFGPLVSSDTVKAGSHDLGRVWSFADPPLDHLAETYDVPADTQGLEALRRRTFRLPGCSGTLVSPDGLLLTAARCVRSRLSSTAPDSLHTEALLARRRDREVPVDSLYAERVVDVETVTERVESRVADRTRGAAERQAAREVQAALAEQAPDRRRVEVVSESAGSRYVAYTYRRYDDVRLVFLPERAVTLFGAGDQLLSYPQHTWEVAAIRVYADGEPIETPRHFEVRRSTPRPGDAVFAVGHPSGGLRAETAEQGATRRDLTLPTRLTALESWSTHAQTYVDTAAASGPTWTQRLQRARVHQKRRRAQLDALDNNYFHRRLEARDATLRRRADDRASRAGAALLDRLAELQTEKRTLADAYRAFTFLMHPTHSSSTLRRAWIAYRARQADAAEGAAAIRAVPDQPRALDAARLQDHRERLRAHLGGDSTIVQVLRGVGRSEGIVKGSVFSGPDAAVDVLGESSLPADDPALRLASALYERYEPFEETWTRLREQEARLTDSLAQVRHQIADPAPALPQDRAPRFANGRVRGYEYNGTVAAPFTTFYGLYGHHAGTSGDGSELPSRWASPQGDLDRSVPLTRIASTDLQGDYGGPLVDRSLQLVGIQIDGNVQSAAGAFLFLPQRMRTVVVDVRGMLEGLASVYGAEALIDELEGEAAPEE